MIASESLNRFWQSYLQSLPAEHPHRSLPLPEAWGFGSGGDLANLPFSQNRTNQRIIDEVFAHLADPNRLTYFD